MGVLLLNPLLNLQRFTQHKPVVVVAVDNSGSMKITSDSVTIFKKTGEWINALKSQSGKYDLRFLLFGKEVSENDQPGFTDKVTDFQKLKDFLDIRFMPGELAGMILISDGLLTAGENPEYLFNNSAYPVFTVLAGDTVDDCDLQIKNIDYNKIVYPNTTTKIAVHIEASLMEGKESEIKILKGNQQVALRKITITSQRFFHTEMFDIQVGDSPFEAYKVELVSGINEKNSINNQRQVIFEVVDQKLNILLLAKAPHPDISAIKTALSANLRYKIDIKRVDQLSGIKMADYQLIILYQLPDAGSMQLIHFEETGIPVWIIVGPGTKTDALQNIFPGIRIQMTRVSYDMAEALPNQHFTGFELTDEDKRVIEHFPPLLCPFADYVVPSGADIILYQKIRNIPTLKPLLAFMKGQDRHVAVLFGEGLWKWRLNCYKQTGNQWVFDRFINQVVQLLSLDQSKQRFVLDYDKITNEGQAVGFKAQLYDKTFNSTIIPDVSLKIKNKQSGKEYSYVFSKGQSSYSLVVHSLPSGEYSFTASVTFGEEIFSKNGEFHVQLFNPELLSQQSNFSLMKRVADVTGGQYFNSDQPDELINAVQQRPDLKKINRSESTFYELIHLKGFFYLILLLLTIEWLVRKLAGTI